MKLLANRRRLKWLLACFLLLGAIVFIVGSLHMGSSLALPSPSKIGPSPNEFPAETVQFRSDTGRMLSGWLARGDDRHGVIVLLHILGGNRWSMLTRAELLRRAGYSVLLFDFQAHGESPGEHSTFGFLEGKDARGAVRFVRERFPKKPVGVVGWSLGGAAALLGEPLGADAVVLEAVYPTIQEAVVDRIRIRLGPLGHLLAPALLIQLKPRLGVSSGELRPIDRIAKLGAPVLIIAGSEDQHTRIAESRRMFATALEPKELWVVDRAGHVDFQRFAPDTYERRVLGFFAKHLETEQNRVAAFSVFGVMTRVHTMP